MSTYVKGFIPPDADWQRMNGALIGLSCACLRIGRRDHEARPG